MHQNGIISNCELADFNVTVTGISDSKRIFGLLVFRASGNAQISNNHFSNGYIFSDCNHCAISVITGDSIEFMKIINNTAEGLRLETLGDNSPISFCISTTSNDIIEITGNTVIGSTMLTSGNNSGISIGVNKLYTFNLVGKLNINDNALLKSKIQASGTNSRFAVGIVSSNAIDKQIVTCYNNLLLNSTVIMTGNNGHIGIGIALVASTYSAVNNTAIDSNLIATGENSAISAGVGFSKHTNKTSDIRKLIAGNTMINCNISNKKNPELVHAGLGNYKAGSSAGINISTSMSVNNILNGEPFKENVGENAIGKCKHVNPCFLSHDCKINYEGISQAMLSIKNNNYLNGNSSFNCTDPLLRTIPVLAAPLAIGWGLAAAGFVGAAAGAGCCYQWYQGYQTGDRGRKLAKRPLVKTLDCLEAVGGWCLSGYGNASKNGKNTTTKEVTPNRDGNIEDNGAGESESFIQQQNNDAASQSCWSRLYKRQTKSKLERKIGK